MDHVDIASLSDHDLLKALRQRRPARHRIHPRHLPTGQQLADMVAARVGSWPFIVIQSSILALWIAANAVGWLRAWDPYPFILLNLMLSFQAAYTAPIIMMSQNRQAEIDRRKVDKDYDVNLKAELEVEALHQKIDALRDQEIRRLTELVEALIAAQRPPAPPPAG
ncbi:MAG: DUF1003 domain-containing protein [Rhodospirillaceae bacterium]|nr:DUF1003 domain-containing protein [Rhodospirillaceae bacterium]